ncbi:MAG TPA: hypothetical protein VF407_03835, partial [Polyangiaceae bacterium]
SDAKTADNYATASNQMDYAKCTDGSKIGPNCGLILDAASSEDFRMKFHAKVCANKDADACNLAYRRFLDAELAHRYFAADWDAVARECDRNPGTCDEGTAYERLLLDSHNLEVRRHWSDEQAKIDEERARRHAIDDAQGMAAVNETILTAAALGNHTSVCHSYPSIFGGETTTCVQ